MPLAFRFVTSAVATIAISLISVATVSTARGGQFERYCAAAGPSNILFIDVTTAFTPLDRQQLEAGLDKIVRRLQSGERLSVLTLADSFAKIATIFDECRPGCGQGTSGALTGTCSELRVRNQDVPRFNTALATAVAQIIPTASLRASDIALSLAYGLRGRALRPGDTVFVFSDMIEKSPLLDLLPAGQPVQTIDSRRKDNMVKLKRGGFDLDLRGARLVVFGFGRNDKDHAPLDPVSAQAVRGFWTDLLKNHGAQDVLFQSEMQ